MKSKYSIAEDIDGFASDFDRVVNAEDSNFDLVDIKYANGIWFGAYGDNIGKPKLFVDYTAWNFEPSFSSFTEEIESRKAEGYELTDVEYTEGGYWFGVFAEGEVDSKLITAETMAGIDEQVEELQALDPDDLFQYQVVDLEYTDESIVGVLNSTHKDAAYTSSEDFEEFESEVQRQQDEGLELTNLEYVDGDFVGIFDSELTGESIYSPEPHADLDDFTAEIEEFRSTGYDLLNIESIDGDWFGIYKENLNATGIITPSESDSDSNDMIRNQLLTDINNNTSDIFADSLDF